MGVARSDFENICEGDVQSLKENGVGEDVGLEFKRDLYGISDSDKREFLKDVSAFANTAGGDLIIGIAPNGEIVGVEADFDAEKLRLESLLRDRIEPRILGIRIKPIPLHDGRHALLIRIPKSWNPPHAVLHNRSRLVFARNSAGVHEASVDEMRSMFTAGATLLEQARAFQAQRMAIVHEGNGPFSNFGGEGGRLVMHLIPFSAFGSDVMLEPARLHGAYLPPLWSTGFNHGYNVDGYYTHCERNGLGGYVEVFRNGIVESAAGDVRHRQQDRDPIIYATSVEDQIATKAHDYLAALQNAGVAPPVLIMVAGGRMAGTTVIGNPVAALPPGSQALPANIRFPTVTLDDFVDIEGCRRALRPVFDAIWNAAGYPRSQNFDAEGKWAPKHS